MFNGLKDLKYIGVTKTMEYELPAKDRYTVYTKSGCKFCVKAKDLLKNETIDVIDCDDYLVEDRSAFLEFIKGIVGKEYNTFPMIFGKDGAFIGGFTDLRDKEFSVEKQSVELNPRMGIANEGILIGVYHSDDINHFPDPFAN